MSDSQSISSELAEPYLNYSRLQGDVEINAEKESYTCVAVHQRYLALGTNSGKVMLFNSNNKLFKILNAHVGRVNAISVDKSGDTIATAGEDGFVYIYILSEDSRISHKYVTAVRAVRLDCASKEKTFVCGGLKGQLILNKKSWFTYQDIVVHENEGPISTIAYSYPFVAWCSEYGTNIYNIETETKVFFVPKPKDVPETSVCKPRLCWYGNSRLCIGWGATLITVRMNFKMAAGNKVWYGEIGSTLPLEYWVCGLGIYDDENITVLGYDRPEANSDSQPPCIYVVNCQSGVCESEECLPIKGYEHYGCMDYQLESNVTSPTSSPLPLYLVSPHAVVRITPRTPQDHVDWAVQHEDYERALQILTDRANGFSPEHVANMREQHLEYLFSSNQIEKAAALCPSYLGKDESLWERWIARFNGLNKLQLLLPFIPLSEPRLPLPVYTLILNYFLYNDIPSFLSLIRSWPKPVGDPSDLYDPYALLTLLESMKKTKRESAVQESLAELYAMTSQYDKAIKMYLDSNMTNTEGSPLFDWIETHHLIEMVKTSVLQLFRLNSKQASILLSSHMTEVKPQDVIKQLGNEPSYQQEYLHELFCSHTSEYNTEEFKSLHALQLDLLIQFNSPDLLFFLETSQEYDVPTALNKCLHSSQPHTREVIYLYSRLGDTTRALQMIVQDLGDVDMALEFVQKWKDRDLWDDLVTYSVVKPEFVGALLDRAGEFINAITLVECIPEGMEIPQLKERLIHVLDNYSLELELRQGCNTILTSDMAELYERLVKAKMAGIRLDPTAVCTICQQELFQIRKATRTCPPPAVVAFYCSHLYHRSCLEHVCGRFDDKAEGEPVKLRCIRCESGDTSEAHEGQDALDMAFELQPDIEDE